MTQQTFGIGPHRTRDGRIAEVTNNYGDYLAGFINEKRCVWTMDGTGCGEASDLISPIDEQPDAVRDAITKFYEPLEYPDIHKDCRAEAVSWTDITTTLPGHHHVVIVQDEEGNVSVARMEVDNGLSVVYGIPQWLRFGTVKRWRLP